MVVCDKQCCIHGPEQCCVDRSAKEPRYYCAPTARIRHGYDGGNRCSETGMPPV
jgi:hypothetical protein